MKVNVIYNGRKEKGILLEKMNKYWLIRIDGLGDRKIDLKDILSK